MFKLLPWKWSLGQLIWSGSIRGGKAHLCNHNYQFSWTISEYFSFTLMPLLVPRQTWCMNKSLWAGMPLTLMIKVRIVNSRSHNMHLIHNEWAHCFHLSVLKKFFTKSRSAGGKYYEAKTDWSIKLDWLKSNMIQLLIQTENHYSPCFTKLTWPLFFRHWLFWYLPPTGWSVSP